MLRGSLICVYLGPITPTGLELEPWLTLAIHLFDKIAQAHTTADAPPMNPGVQTSKYQVSVCINP